MLRKLLYREWMLNRQQYLIVLAMVAVFQIYFVLRADSARAWIVFTGIFMSFQTIVPFTREEKFQAAAWTLTLPVRRREIVRARWAVAWLNILAGVLIALAVALLLPGRIDPAQALVPDTLLLTAAVSSLILALLMPFTIRFGLMGVMIFLVAAQVVGAGLLVALTMSVGRTGAAGRAPGVLIEGIRAGLLSVQGALTPSVFQVTALAALLLLNWIGYRTALALYRRREF